MAKLTQDQIKAAVLEQIQDAEGYETDELARVRQESLDYYYNRPSAAPSAPGRSSLQSSDVADMTEALIAQVMPAFEQDNVVEFEPLTEDDVDQARLETDTVNYVVMQQNNGYYEIQQAVRDALLLRNGIIKVYLDEKVETAIDNYDMLTQDQYNTLMMEHNPNLKDVDNGYSVQLKDSDKGFFNVRVTTKTTTRKVCTKAIDPANFSWERDYDSIYLDDVRFCAERSLPTRSELIGMGYKKSVVNQLNAGGNDTQLDSLARNQSAARRNWRGSTPAEDIIEMYECYMRLDADGDGQTELLKIIVASDTVLDVEEIDYVPYASGTPFLQPHRFNGLGMFDKLRYIQDAKTATLRQLVDNQNHANNARVGVVDGQVNIDDVVNSRPGGVVRMRSPDSIVPFPFTDIGGSAQATLEYMDKIRSERGGASLDMLAAELQIAGDTAHGVERQMSAKEQLAAMITRTLAETLIRKTFELVHIALRLYVPDELTFRINDKFQQANPAEWQKRDRINVKAGLSMGERMRKKMALETIITQQYQLAQTGKAGIMTDDAAMYNAQLDWARCQGIDNPERYFLDPESEQAMQAAQQMAQQQQQQQQYQQSLLEMQKAIEERNADNADAKVMEDARQFDQEIQFKYWAEGMKQETEEAKLATQTALSIVGGNDAKEGRSGESNNNDVA